jgi:hypothetical protein
MRERLEEEPEPEPIPEPEPDEDQGPRAATLVPTVSSEGREFEYRTEILSDTQVSDGTTLVELLNSTSSDSWDLVEIIAAGDKHVVLLRKVKRPERPERRVGFSMPGR